ncbi:hypothetical protein O3Q51_17670 [Cryomorphaceae bacterium 1068]|nr:hypothetical protein [Cryomorphaceae bacterium 1068]
MLRKIPTIGFIALLLLSCSKDDDATCNDGKQNGNETGIDCGGDCTPCSFDGNLDGLAQKGPFLNGSSVTYSELNASLGLTGRTFVTQILDNTGYFQLDNLSLESDFGNIRVDGFYFNEVCGTNSESQITLNSIVNMNDVSSANVNVLTHLEKGRVEYLLDQGSAYAVAKAQAQEEVLSIFEIQLPDGLPSSENLNIANSEEGDAILIAVSSILQGHRSEADFSLLMADILSDIREDGVLDNQSIGADLIAHATLLDTAAIKENLEAWYSDNDMNIDVPFFGNYISDFLANSAFTPSEEDHPYEYPENGMNGVNLLSGNSFDVKRDDYYSLAVEFELNCAELKLILKGGDANCNGCWFITLGTGYQGWDVGSYNESTEIQTFTTSSGYSDIKLSITDYIDTGDVIEIEVYEGSGSIPTRTIQLTVVD